MKKNILSVFYDTLELLIYTDSEGNDLTWTQVDGCILQEKEPISEVRFFYFTKEKEHFQKSLKKYKTKYPHISFSEIEFHCDANELTELIELLFKHVLTHSYDTDKFNYYFLPPRHTALRAFMFYFGVTSRMNIKYMLPEQPTENALGKTQIIMRPVDLNTYRQIAYNCQQKSIEHRSILLGGVDTKHQHITHIVDELNRSVAHSRGPLLLYGATGTGKTRFAKNMALLLKEKGYVQGAFIEVNCATLNKELAASQLFGHLKGSFTGAVTNSKGLMASANNGVLFLDEISLLDMQCQGMLLRAIEDGYWLPIGSHTPVYSNFFLICATNVDLIAESKAGRFREDLLARISMWEYTLPSLKERHEDFEALLNYELETTSSQICSIILMPQDVKKKYLEYALSSQALWKYNFRDLRASVQRMAARTIDGRITYEIVEKEIAYLKSIWKRWEETSFNNFTLTQRYVKEEVLAEMDYFEIVQLEAVLAECLKHKNLAEAGRAIFNKSRNLKSSHNDTHRLRQYLKKFDLNWQALS